ncbi:hypothetical protein A3K24_01235 [candidate division Kazan bacterium RIFCSPHIGHO2_01_FULL_44_14]|uniref:Uncharacterized protein n=1 Tax=candidate division Kazan bacterium RIFCSPLOWO2_01_FULL_45_19 TaxID=1798538 RepID=A0A1F4NQA2_UNCK3|nr:hypothetical protein [uncultured bacterium]OGB73467.1 MAG: hypothetical protein A3K51_01235 [candidate division Kazan bacterium RIFCSPLOWO2_01_FULL_45_19]OGB77712.1 MAG: hypothetical protein A3K24_01235 [candidate division Kazan bacterium RIFCSPHIGHO2_01_FULL_44_14]
MLITPHLLAGVVIAKGIPEAVPAAIAAVTSHFVLDSIPHWDYIGKPMPTLTNIILTVADGLLAFGLWWWLVPTELRWYGLLIGGFAVLPDFLIAPKYLWPKWITLPIVKQFNHWHTAVLQYACEPKTWVIGLLPQVVLVAFLIYFLRG